MTSTDTSTDQQTRNDSRAPRFAVIGAGASGLCIAKHLTQTGFDDVVVFEAGSYVGGIWVYRNDNGRAPAYTTLHINTAKSLTAFPDFPFPSTTQTFPDHRDMREYLESYADHFDLRRRIRFNAPVTSLKPLSDTGAPPQWEVRTATGGVETFDAVFVATGHLTDPHHVTELQQFGEGYLHSLDYDEPASFAGRRVCIVGVGNSACDIASDICTTAERTVLVARSGVVIGPKLIFGVPVSDITMKLYQPWIPRSVRQGIIGFITYLVHGRMTDYGFKPLTKRAHPTTNATLINHIAYKRVHVKTGISDISGRDIAFDDGSVEEFDSLIACTGYRLSFPFLDDKILPVRDNAVRLYKRMVLPDWPGLYFVGLLNTTTALNQIYTEQSRWLLEHLLGTARLPPAPDMWADIAAKEEFIRTHYKDSPRHTIEEEHMPYFRELRRSLRRARRRAQRAPVPLARGAAADRR